MYTLGHLSKMSQVISQKLISFQFTILKFVLANSEVWIEVWTMSLNICIKVKWWNTEG